MHLNSCSMDLGRDTSNQPPHYYHHHYNNKLVLEKLRQGSNPFSKRTQKTCLEKNSHKSYSSSAPSIPHSSTHHYKSWKRIWLKRTMRRGKRGLQSQASDTWTVEMSSARNRTMSVVWSTRCSVDLRIEQWLEPPWPFVFALAFLLFFFFFPVLGLKITHTNASIS